jgi:hypothetical protein
VSRSEAPEWDEVDVVLQPVALLASCDDEEGLWRLGHAGGGEFVEGVGGGVDAGPASEFDLDSVQLPSEGLSETLRTWRRLVA